jgi:hypothetical protein
VILLVPKFSSVTKTAGVTANPGWLGTSATDVGPTIMASLKVAAG